MLTGNLVRLRSYDLDDLDRYVEWFNDPEVTQYMNLYPMMARLAEKDWLEARARAAPQYGEIGLAIETLDGRHIGSVGLHDGHARSRRSVLGIVIGDKTCWSQGYGTDAILTLLRFAFDEMNLNRVMLHVNADNARAIACYRKCGFMEEGRLRQDRYANGRYADTLVMAALAGEFHPAHASPTTTGGGPAAAGPVNQ